VYVLYECVSLTFFDLLSQRKMKKAFSVCCLCVREILVRESSGEEEAAEIESSFVYVSLFFSHQKSKELSSF